MPDRLSAPRPARLLGIAIAALLALSGIPRLPARTGPPVHRALAAARQDASPAALAQRILQGGDVDAVAAVLDAAARAGIPGVAEDGTAVPAVEPSLPMQMPTYQAQALAADAAGRSAGVSRITLAGLAGILAESGWSPPAGSDPGIALQAALRAALAAAQQAPDNPHSFVPLFLEAMAQGGTPAADLSSPVSDPARVPLSLLEVELLLSASLRGAADYPPVAPDSSPPAAGLRTALFRGITGRTAAAAGPCDELEGNLGAFKSVHLVALDQLSGIPFDRFFEAIGAGTVSKFVVSKLLTVLQILASVGLPSLAVSVDPSEQHYSHGDEQNRATWTATLILPDLSAGQDAVEQAVRGCLSTLGFAVDSGQLQAAQQSWLVRWDIAGLGPPYALRQHATVGTDENQFYLLGGQNLAMQLGDSGQVQLVADLSTEDETVHQTGIERHDTAWVAATLDTSSIDATPFIQAAIGDVPDALLGVLGEWYKSLFGPRKEADLAVSWHEPARFTLVFDSTITTASAGSVPGARMHVHAEIPLTLSAAGELEGSAPALLVDYGLASGCGNAHDAVNGTATVRKGRVSAQPAPGDPGVTLLFDPGLESVRLTGRPCSCNPPQGGGQRVLRPAVAQNCGDENIQVFFQWALFHASDLVTDASGAGNAGFAIYNWSPGSGDVYARKTYQSTLNGSTESTTFELRRTAGP